MIKKFFCILSIFLILFSVSGCGSKDTTSTANDASLTVENETTDRELNKIANGRTIEFNVFSKSESYNKGEEYILKNDTLNSFTGTVVYSKDGKYKKMIKKEETYIVEDNTDLFYKFGSIGSVYLSGKINMNGKDQKYYLKVHFTIIDYEKLFNQINLNNLERNWYNGIGGSQIFEHTFKDYLNKNINIIIKDYMLKENTSFESLDFSLSFSEYAVNKVNKNIESKYGITIEKIDLKTK